MNKVTPIQMGRQDLNASASTTQGRADICTIAPLLGRVADGLLPFTFFYQPIVDVHGGCVAGYEALVRFPQELGMPPDLCFLAAEACGLRRKLEYRVLSQALASKAILPPNTFLTVNASPDFLLSDEWDYLLSTLPTLNGVVIEITEQDSIEDYEAMRKKIEAIREHSGLVAVDDTGAGYASLKHMMELRPNFLKLDRYFIGECHSQVVKSTLIEMIGKVASRMDAWIVAEGVEKSEELDELIRLSVPLVQGYHLARPEPGMRPLAEDKVITLRSRVHALTSQETLLREMEDCLSCDNLLEASQRMRESPDIRHVAVVDAWGRPVRILERHALLGLHEVRDVLRIPITSDPVEVLERALLRPEESRFDCMAAIDEKGQLMGVLRIDRLMRSVLNAGAQATGAQVLQMPAVGGLASRG